MINKRLIKLSSESMVNIKNIVICQLLSMLSNVVLIFTIASHITAIYLNQKPDIMRTVITFISVIIIRAILKIVISKQGVIAASSVKIKLRKAIYNKILKLGGNYTNNVSTAEVVQVSSEGVEQLEMYFANYLPQFFYCMTAPLILFIILSQISFISAFVLFICVPLIPISIVIVQKIAKKLLSKYWSLYAGLGDSFLENIQGMTTLKIYGADEEYHKDMNKNAQNFREITMKVLSMQLNSIIVMDIVAYGGASLGAILAITQLINQQIDITGACIIILLASEFFLPMRMLGSFFHIAMNGMAASKKIFNILDMEEPKEGSIIIEEIPNNLNKIELENISFSYNNENTILSNINLSIPTGLTSIVGVSGSGKSTIVSLLISKYTDYQGEIKVFGNNILDINKSSLYKNITRVTDKGYIFTGSVYDNLLMADENASKEEMISVLKKANIWELFEQNDGLDTMILERGSNLSGGEKQRLNIARALLKNSKIYIFDEVTSNIDSESEDDIMKIIRKIAETKIVILISHRLQNVVKSDNIYMLHQGEIVESGNHEKLISNNSYYHELYNTQWELEKIRSCDFSNKED